MEKKFLIIIAFLITSLVSAQSKHSKDIGQKFRIPVVFHVVHKDISEKQEKEGDTIRYPFENLIDAINVGFNERKPTYIAGGFKDNIASCNIEFFLAEKDENGLPMSPISWHKTDKEFYVKKENDENLKKLGYKNSKKYLNIWICNVVKGYWLEEQCSFPVALKNESIWGYSTLPNIVSSSRDGIVLNSVFLFGHGENQYNKENAGFAINHEIGHWLGLNHIWGKKGCSIDDGIEDTPMQNSPHEDGFTEVQNSCNDNTVKTNYQNFMDYSLKVGMFTEGQKNVMRSTLLNERIALTNNLINNTTISSPNEGQFTEKTKITFDDFNTYILKSNNLNFRKNRNYLKKYSKLDKKKSILKYTRQNENLAEEDFNLLINKLQKKVNDFKYSKTYQKSVSFKLGYSSKEKKLQVKLPNELYATGMNCILYNFKEIKKPYQIMNKLALVGINHDEFNAVPVEETQGVTPFFRSFKNSNVYAVIDYSLLPITLKQRFNVGNTKMLGMFAYIHNVYLFSDKNHTNLIYTMKPKNKKKYFNNVSYGLYEYSNLNLSWKMRLIYK